MNRPRYPEYKPSGVEWLGEVPRRWEVKRLKFAAACINDKQDELSDGSSYVAMEHIESWTGKRLDIENGITPESQTSRFQKDDVLFGKLRPYLAKSWLADRDGACSTELLVLRGRELDPAYLLYWTLMRPFIEIVDGSTYGSKMPRANWDFIGNMLTSIPARDEQRAIAAFLDRETARIDALIEKKRRFIELLQEKRAALISRAVTRGLDPNVPLKDSGVEWLGQIPAHWEMWKVAHAFRHIGSGTTPPASEYEWYEGDIPWVTTGELRENIISKTEKYITQESLKQFPALEFHPANSLVIAMYGATIGRLGILEIPATTNQACCVLADSSILNTKYVFYVMLGFRQEIVSLSSGGGQPNISQDKIRSLHIPRPPLNEQGPIVNYLGQETEKLDALCAKVESAIEKLKEYRTALIAAAVTGKIDVREG